MMPPVDNDAKWTIHNFDQASALILCASVFVFGSTGRNTEKALLVWFMAQIISCFGLCKHEIPAFKSEISI